MIILGAKPYFNNAVDIIICAGVLISMGINTFCKPLNIGLHKKFNILFF